MKTGNKDYLRDKEKLELKIVRDAAKAANEKYPNEPPEPEKKPEK